MELPTLTLVSGPRLYPPEEKVICRLRVVAEDVHVSVEGILSCENMRLKLRAETRN